MCMLIHHPASAEPFSRAEFADFHRRNPNGFGAIWRTPSGAVHDRKGLMRLTETWPLYRSLVANGCEEIVLHWRYATAGPVDWTNCHPIPVTREILVMHNGVLSHRHTRAASDTWCFVVDVLRPRLERDPALIHDPSWTARVAGIIGGGNKLVFWHRNEARPVIVGEERGVWYQGRWYSNTYAWSVPRGVR